MLNNIDVIFRDYGVKALGEETMARLSDEQIDEARVYAFTALGERTKRYGKQESGTCEKLFIRKCQRMLGLEVTP